MRRGVYCALMFFFSRFRLLFWPLLSPGGDTALRFCVAVFCPRADPRECWGDMLRCWHKQAWERSIAFVVFSSGASNSGGDAWGLGVSCPRICWTRSDGCWLNRSIPSPIGSSRHFFVAAFRFARLEVCPLRRFAHLGRVSLVDEFSLRRRCRKGDKDILCKLSVEKATRNIYALYKYSVEKATSVVGY